MTLFSDLDLSNAVKDLKTTETQGTDNIPTEFVKQSGPKCRSWLRDFFSACLTHLSIPKIWRKATVIALPKPNKPVDDPRSYRPIPLLCVPYKLFERLLLLRLEPIVDPQLPDHQAGFRRGRSTVQQVVELIVDIEACFEKKQKADLVLVDLTAAYYSAWHQGLTLKFPRVVPYRQMVRFIVNILSNRCFKLKTSDGQRSRLRRLRNGLPQCASLAPLLFNIYISDIPLTRSCRYGYADDLALLYSNKSLEELEKTLSADMCTIAEYL